MQIIKKFFKKFHKWKISKEKEEAAQRTGVAHMNAWKSDYANGMPHLTRWPRASSCQGCRGWGTGAHCPWEPNPVPAPNPQRGNCTMQYPGYQFCK